ncbi:MAG: hypothetical protein H6622_02940 [Halobacteriovoraceae bacterium]|nr:hypothetical protein [Halobacteriovoraceae bacterium]
MLASLGQLQKEYQSLKSRHYKRVKQSQEVLQNACKTSAEEFFDGLKGAIKDPSSLSALNLIKDSVGSSVWIGHSYIKFLNSLIDFSKNDFSHLDNFKHHYIIDHVISQTPIKETLISDQEIFQAIYEDLEYSYANPHYETTLRVPKIAETIVLVSGVFNELFKTEAFERAAAHLSKKYSIRYINGQVSGIKSSFHNQDMLYEQISKLVKHNPKEKFYLFAYSKGGIDALHMMAKYKDFAREHIQGLSCIASPIQGSSHIESLVFKLAEFIHNHNGTGIYTDSERDLEKISQEFQKCLLESFRLKWLEENKDNLLYGAFYTSVALESQWYESHLWMVLAKIIFNSSSANDGVVEAKLAKFPENFPGINLGIVKGHHLISARSSFYSQEALLEAHIIFLHYKKFLN